MLNIIGHRGLVLLWPARSIPTMQKKKFVISCFVWFSLFYRPDIYLSALIKHHLQSYLLFRSNMISFIKTQI